MFWAAVAGTIATKQFFSKALRAAAAVHDSQTATMLLAPFALERVGRSHVRALAALADQYDEPWATALVAGWSARRERYRGHDGTVATEAWLLTLPELGDACRDAGDPGCASDG